MATVAGRDQIDRQIVGSAENERPAHVPVLREAIDRGCVSNASTVLPLG
jgi:hypothetical protein